MSSFPWISHHLFVSAAVQEKDSGPEFNPASILPSVGFDGAVVDGSPEKWKPRTRRRERARPVSASLIGESSS